jgi:superfamily II DNA or RNA helicase
MISIFNDLIENKKIKNININDYIETYKDTYLELDKSYDYYYEKYNNIKETIIEYSLDEEIKLYETKNPDFYDFKSEINSLFTKSCLLESLKLVIHEKSLKDKDLKKSIKNYKKKKYNYYPNITDYNNYEDYIKEITLRKEFNIHHIPKNKKSSCNKETFELAPHQLFLKNLFNTSTPYNGILIFHGVGVGKTCSGVSIAENFKNSERKTIILAPEKIQEGWNKNIFDPKKGKNQCTEDEYIYEEDKYEKNKSKMVNNKIKEFYEKYGYLSFSNSVQNYLEDNLRHIPEKDKIARKNKEIELIKEKYSNRVLIIDEVHNVRTVDPKSVRDTIFYIEKVITHSDNLKLILLTANPMFNEPEEIIWILNMLLLNDNRPKINHKLKYDSDNNLSKESYKIIEDMGKGYVSYLRGENPSTFPYRLYPTINKVNPKFKKDLFDNPFDKKNELLFLELYGSELKGKQLEIYSNELNNLEETTLMDQESRLLQISNCVYPYKSDNVEDLYGEKGLINCFTKSGKKNIKYSYRDSITNFLDLDKLEEYSSKIYNIIQSINESEGIIFIYSHYLNGGIIPLVLALEQNGYKKFDGNEVLNSENKRKPISYDGKLSSETDDFKQATYSVIAGESIKLTSNFESELEVAVSKGNKNGELIKVIIGSDVAAEGLDFKNIRAIHLLEPWHNINKLEQVIGRGIRNCSHIMLDDEKDRNVTIYLHTTTMNNRETIESYLYRRCERKAKQIGQVELLLKKIAIDKYLFQYSNIIKKDDIAKITVKPSRRLDESFNVIPYDKPYSRSCSFLKDCNYIGENSVKLKKKIYKDYELDTFSLKYSQPLINIYKEKIKQIILDYYCFDFNILLNFLKEKIEYINFDILYHSLYQMISDKDTIETKNNISGYLKFIDDYYIFQPFDNSDVFLPLYYRINRGIIDKNEYILDTDEKVLLETSKILEFNEKQITDKYDEIINSVLSSEEDDCFKIKNNKNKNLFSDYVKYNYIIDRLRFKDKCLLIYSLFLYLLEDVKFDKKYNDFINILLQIFSPLFIYYNEDTGNYEWNNVYDKKNMMKIFGGFISWHERKECKFYRYNSKKMYECNELQKRNILLNFKEIPKKEIYNKNIFGYIEYNKNYKLIQNGIVLKIKRKKDKTGNIFISSSTSEWTSETGLKFIKGLSKDIWGSILQKDIENIESRDNKGKLKKSKFSIAILIELIMRESKNLIQGDLIWLYKI